MYFCVILPQHLHTIAPTSPDGSLPGCRKTTTETTNFCIFCNVTFIWLRLVDKFSLGFICLLLSYVILLCGSSFLRATQSLDEGGVPPNFLGNFDFHAYF